MSLADQLNQADQPHESTFADVHKSKNDMYTDIL
jgi:hypothetical protein